MAGTALLAAFCGGIDFYLRTVHNPGVMLRDDEALIRWAGQNLRSGVTLGQLAALVELLGSPSVAALGGASVGRAVNYRQKLARLERALGVGALMRRTGNVTQVSHIGEQVAGEVRLLLRELRSIEQSAVPSRAWTVGAGDAWLQSVILPALAGTAAGRPAVRWEVRNLRAAEIVQALRDGRLDFGFLRSADLPDDRKLTKVRQYRGASLVLFAGNAADAPEKPAGLLQWLHRLQRPLIQQGTTWRPLREQLPASLRNLLAGTDPVVTSETHLQAAAAAAQSDSWCIVPAKVAGLFSVHRTRVVELAGPQERDDMVLVTNSRHTDKLPHAREVIQRLRSALNAAC